MAYGYNRHGRGPVLVLQIAAGIVLGFLILANLEVLMRLFMGAVGFVILAAFCIGAIIAVLLCGNYVWGEIVKDPANATLCVAFIGAFALYIWLYTLGHDEQNSEESAWIVTTRGAGRFVARLKRKFSN